MMTTRKETITTIRKLSKRSSKKTNTKTKKPPFSTPRNPTKKMTFPLRMATKRRQGRYGFRNGWYS